MSLPSLSLALRRRWPTAVLTLAVVAGVAAAALPLREQSATAKARVIARGGRVDGGLIGGSVAAPVLVEAPSPSAVEALVRSPRVLEAAARELGAGSTPPPATAAAAPSPALVAALREAVSVTRPDPAGQVLDLRLVDRDPGEACRRVNALARALVDAVDNDARVGMETAATRLRLAAEESAGHVAALRAELGVLAGIGGDPEADKAALAAALRELDLRIDSLCAGAAQREEEVKALLLRANLEKGITAAPVIPESVAVPQLQELAGALARARGEQANLELTRFPDDDAVKAQRAKVEEIQGRFLQAQEQWRIGRLAALQTEINQAQREIDIFERRRQERRAELGALNERLMKFVPARATLAAAERELDGYRDLDRRFASYWNLLPKFVELAEAAERAEPSGAPAAPWFGIWGLVAFAAAGFGAWLRELCGASAVELAPPVAPAAPVAAPVVAEDLPIAPIDQTEALRLVDLPIVGHVPRGAAADVAGAFLDGAPSDLTEVYGGLATLLRASLGEGGMKTVGVLSAVPGEGKTSLALGLACAFARKGLRTVLIDADLRTPQVHALTGLPNASGLSTLLEGRWPAPESGRFGRPEDPREASDMDMALKEHFLPSLRVITGGPTPASPQLLLESASMRGVLNELKEMTDVVIVDTPALSAVGEGLSIGTMTDVNLLVVGSGVATREDLAWVRGLLGSVPVNLLGFVLNFSAWRPGARAPGRARRRSAAAVPALEAALGVASEWGGAGAGLAVGPPVGEAAASVTG
ncbi:MAG: CpsD/CapB family tyrosine-protein kinase [Planctomycetes bacterium]|nr:CpsD/CapB family tyrosine-protein kinase [Planctomycetota bacterium]